MRPILPPRSSPTAACFSKTRNTNNETGGVEFIEIDDDNSSLSKVSTNDRTMLMMEYFSVEFEEYNDYLYKVEELMVQLEQKRDPLFTLRGGGDSNERNLFNSMKRFGYDYAHEIGTCIFVFDGNPDILNLTNIINRSEKPPILNPDVRYSIIDGKHRHAAILHVNEKLNEDSHEWSRGYFG